MTQEEYYTTPPQEIFDDIQQNAMKLWERDYGNTGDYVTEKIMRIGLLPNYQDNAWYIVNMFDDNNKMKLMSMVREETFAMIARMLQES